MTPKGGGAAGMLAADGAEPSPARPRDFTGARAYARGGARGRAGPRAAALEGACPVPRARADEPCGTGRPIRDGMFYTCPSLIDRGRGFAWSVISAPEWESPANAGLSFSWPVSRILS